MRARQTSGSTRWRAMNQDCDILATRAIVLLALATRLRLSCVPSSFRCAHLPASRGTVGVLAVAPRVDLTGRLRKSAMMPVQQIPYRSIYLAIGLTIAGKQIARPIARRFAASWLPRAACWARSRLAGLSDAARTGPRPLGTRRRRRRLPPSPRPHAAFAQAWPCSFPAWCFGKPRAPTRSSVSGCWACWSSSQASTSRGRCGGCRARRGGHGRRPCFPA